MSSICSPAIAYLIISSIFLIASVSSHPLHYILAKAFFMAVWAWFLNYLCQNGHGSVSWFLVILPWILLVAIFAIAIYAKGQ
jgi:hypothetical protein